MFQYDKVMCCCTCFEEMQPMLTDDDGNPILYICPNCGKVTDITEEL